MHILERFESGTLFMNQREVDFRTIPWSPHAAFAGVALKHLITAKDTDGKFSYHLVRIEPNMKIGLHIHETQLETHEVVRGGGICHLHNQELAYEIGTVAVLPAGVEHEVNAGESGLYLFAKFFPALC